MHATLQNLHGHPKLSVCILYQTKQLSPKIITSILAISDNMSKESPLFKISSHLQLPLTIKPYVWKLHDQQGRIWCCLCKQNKWSIIDSWIMDYSDFWDNSHRAVICSIPFLVFRDYSCSFLLIRELAFTLVNILDGGIHAILNILWLVLLKLYKVAISIIYGATYLQNFNVSTYVCI